MNQAHTSTDKFDAVKRCFDAYGADLSRWPDGVRERYGVLALSDEMADARRAAETLDGFLNAAIAPRVSADLKNRIIAQYNPETAAPSFGQLLRDLAPWPRFVPASALAGIGVLGLALGILTANTQAALTPEAEAYAYLEDTMALALLDQEEAAQWDED